MAERIDLATSSTEQLERAELARIGYLRSGNAKQREAACDDLAYVTELSARADGVRACETCGGTGIAKLSGDFCTNCNGKGRRLGEGGTDGR